MLRRGWTLLLWLAGVLLAGCSSKDAPMSPVAPAPTPLSVSPAEGSGVRLDAPVILTFLLPVDRAVVQRELRLISERDMTRSGCPDSATMSHPDMAHCMADSTMMGHLDRYHALPGRYAWNAAGTVCSFQPDSMMAPLTRHMIHMGRGMMEMVEGRMGGGPMGGHGSGMMSGHMMLHFTTMDGGGGHDGHH